MATLPDDILHLLCDVIADRRDFDTLFACAISGKRFALPALMAMYRVQHHAPVKGGGGDVTGAQMLHEVQSWSTLWRSIILSAMGKTLLPYCTYIRVLDFRDFDSLLEDEKFRNKLMKTFFSGDLASFHDQQNSESKKSNRGRVPVFRMSYAVRTKVIEAIGDTVSQHSPLIEQITGPVLSSGLKRWVPRLPRLRSLDLWEGEALSDPNIADLLSLHCPNFEELSLYQWPSHDNPKNVTNDHKLGIFLSRIPNQRLKSFETISTTGISKEVFSGLNRHWQTLRHLKIYINSEAYGYLNLLRDCTNLENFALTSGDGGIDLENLQNDVFLEMIAWLRGCHGMRSIYFAGFTAAAALMSQVLLEDKIRLEQLTLDAYETQEQQKFHSALGNQSSLTSLYLRASSEDVTFEDRVIFVESLILLKDLRYLNVDFRGEDEEFLSDQQILMLAEHMDNIEELLISGYGLTDVSLTALSRLQRLRILTFTSLSAFTVNGLLDFIASLGPEQHGFSLVVDAADPSSALNDTEMDLVRETLDRSVHGTFEYQLTRDPDVISLPDDSD